MISLYFNIHRNIIELLNILLLLTIPVPGLYNTNLAVVYYIIINKTKKLKWFLNAPYSQAYRSNYTGYIVVFKQHSFCGLFSQALRVSRCFITRNLRPLTSSLPPSYLDLKVSVDSMWSRESFSFFPILLQTLSSFCGFLLFCKCQPRGRLYRFMVIYAALDLWQLFWTPHVTFPHGNACLRSRINPTTTTTTRLSLPGKRRVCRNT